MSNLDDEHLPTETEEQQEVEENENILDDLDSEDEVLKADVRRAWGEI